ncbi:hypothetical protein BT63DRAFT_419183 [Microthyrium microscopicum]|uniref:Uncharacterized protein n=1 Tax=Microthyrium microscopicum TaxID=703497 RepID=A0A6A6TTI8_9PEZI|nr:hypothetical protein BT63DRAFT_419183 [Microthyrium microscopicum]
MTYSSITKNLGDIERKLTKSIKILEKQEKMSVGDTIKLARKTNSIVSTINKGIKDYENYTPSEDEAKKIFDQMTKVVDQTEKQLTLLVSNKAHFEKLHVGGLVKKNMGKSDEASARLAEVMLTKAPASLKPQAEELNKRRVDGFAKGKAAFASATGGEDQAEGEDDSD